MRFLTHFPRLLAVLLVLVATGACAADVKFYPLSIHAKDGAQMFQVELANTPESMARGLMYRKSLDADKGMLFVFPTEQTVSFWMKNTLIPLDMVFIAKDGTIGHIHPMAKPLDESPISSTMPIVAVLEIAGGQAAKRGLQPGNTIETSLLEGSKK